MIILHNVALSCFTSYIITQCIIPKDRQHNYLANDIFGVAVLQIEKYIIFETPYTVGKYTILSFNTGWIQR